MLRSVSICLFILGVSSVTDGISTKVDFGEEESSVVKNTSKEDEDVEIKHTIVVSTKLKNNNRRGLHTNGETADLTYSIGGKNERKEDNDEVPVIKGYRALETTQIRTPDSRFKPTTFVYPEIIFQNRNARDEFDLYPNFVANTQWKPSSFFNNINSWNQADNYARTRPEYQKFHRRVTDDGVREFYCRKCRELSGPRGCGESRTHSWTYESTTPKIKIDGKIAKLN